MTIAASFRYNYPDLLAATWLTVRKRWLWSGAAKYLGVLTAVFFAIMTVSSKDISPPELLINLVSGFAFSAVCFAAMLLCWLWCVPRNVRKTFKQMELEGQDVQYLVSDGGIEIQDATTNLKLPWSKWLKWTENDRFLLLYRTDLNAHFVPKELVEPELVGSIKKNLALAKIRQF